MSSVTTTAWPWPNGHQSSFILRSLAGKTIKVVSVYLNRVTHQVVTNHQLTSKQKFRFGRARPGQARPKWNFCFEVIRRFITTWCVTLYILIFLKIVGTMSHTTTPNWLPMMSWQCWRELRMTQLYLMKSMNSGSMSRRASWRCMCTSSPARRKSLWRLQSKKIDFYSYPN